jgi:hypothetical protein
MEALSASVKLRRKRRLRWTGRLRRMTGLWWTACFRRSRGAAWFAGARRTVGLREIVTMRLALRRALILSDDGGRTDARRESDDDGEFLFHTVAC